MATEPIFSWRPHNARDLVLFRARTTVDFAVPTSKHHWMMASGTVVITVISCVIMDSAVDGMSRDGLRASTGNAITGDDRYWASMKANAHTMRSGERTWFQRTVGVLGRGSGVKLLGEVESILFTVEISFSCTCWSYLEIFDIVRSLPMKKKLLA